jgi:hypothetical protein
MSSHQPPHSRGHTWRRLSVGFCSAICLVLASNVALAQPVASADVAAAESLFAEGKASFKAAPDVACSKFEESFRLNANASVQTWIARCHVGDGRLGRAWQAYLQALDLNRRASRQRDALKLRIEAEMRQLEPQVPKLDLSVSPEGENATVFVDDQAIAHADLAHSLYLDPGIHSVRVEAPGFVPASLTIELAHGGRVTRAIVLLPEKTEQGAISSGPSTTSAVAEQVPSLAPPASPLDARAAAPPPRASADGVAGGSQANRRLAGELLGGVGLVGLGLAGYFGIRTLQLVASADCNSSHVCSEAGAETIDAAREEQRRGIIAAVVGASALGAGLVLALTAPAGAKSSRGTLTTSLRIGVGGLAVSTKW